MSPSRVEKIEKSQLEDHKKQLKSLVDLLESILDFNRWGFHQSYTFVSAKSLPCVIYNSEWCRVQFSMSGGDQYYGNELSVYYGRLHAPDDEAFIIWNGEKCNCWHHVNDALDFLDGLSPQEAVDELRVKKQMPRVIEQFRQTDYAKELRQGHIPEWQARLHAAIWEHYGQRLFELFDLRRPDLWAEFTGFVKEYYRIQNQKPASWFPYPPEDKIC